MRRAVPPDELTVQMSSGSPSVSTEAARADRPSAPAPNDAYRKSARAPVWSAEAKEIVEPSGEYRGELNGARFCSGPISVIGFEPSSALDISASPACLESIAKAMRDRSGDTVNPRTFGKSRVRAPLLTAMLSST